MQRGYLGASDSLTVVFQRPGIRGERAAPGVYAISVSPGRDPAA